MSITSGAIFNYTNRRALSTGIAVLIALVLSDTLQLRSAGWMVIAAFLMCQTTRGAALRQDMIMTFCLLAAILVAIFLNTYVNSRASQVVLGLLMVASACVMGMYYPVTRQRFVLFALFPLLLLIAVLEPYHYTLIHDQRFEACLMGVVTGMVITLLMAPANAGKEFAKGLYPLLQAMQIYSKSLRIYSGRNEFDQSIPDKIKVEQALLADVNAYPEWVFEIGFNPGLRSGFRYFLVNLDHAIECLFSLSSFFNSKLDPELMGKLQDVLNESLIKNTELITILCDYFRGLPLPANTSDFTRDLQDLEVVVKGLVPDRMEFIDLSPDTLPLTIIIRDIKDLRHILLQLIAALPTT